VFEVLTLPPRLVAQAVEDLHTLAVTLRKLIVEIQGFRGDIAELRDKIPGL